MEAPKASPNEHIHSYIDRYTRLEKAPSYAVLIAGAWGSGKSWLIRNYVARADPEKFLYVSVYGAASTAEIAERIFVALHPILTSKGAAIAGRVIKGLVKTTLNIDLNGDTKSDLSIGSSVPEVGDLLRSKSSLGGRTLVLDDIERCTVEGKQLWGFINHLVEHEGAKVIIISCEGEIDDGNYRQTKEKNIGMTFEVTPDTVGALNNFIAEQHDAAIPALRQHHSSVLQLFDASGCKSLRVLRFAVRDFAQVFGKVTHELRARPEIVTGILLTSLALAIEVHGGSLKASSIFRLSQIFYLSRGEDVSPEDRSIELILSKYQGITDLSSPSPTLAWWEAFFARGEIDTESLNGALSRRYNPVDERPSWERLWQRTQLTDEQFNRLLDETWTKLSSNEYRSVGPLLHVTSLQLWATNEGLSTRDKASVVMTAKEALDELDDDQLLTDYDQDSYAGYGGLMYVDRGESFIDVWNHAKERRDEALVARTNLDAHNLLDTLAKGGRDFTEALREPRFSNEILGEIKVADFVPRLLELDPQSQDLVIWSIGTRMNDSRILERTWLVEVADLIVASLPPSSLRRHILNGRLAGILSE
jgi:hypothetical protein